MILAASYPSANLAAVTRLLGLGREVRIASIFSSGSFADEVVVGVDATGLT
jgi:hypothetical protein